MLIHKWLTTFGKYLILMGRAFSRPERMRMFLKQYVKEMSQLGIDSIGIVLLISFFIGAVICIQMKVNIQSPWMPHWVAGYATREIMLLEFSSSIMCLILAGKVGSNIASELGTMRVTQQIDAPGDHGCQFGQLPHPAEDTRLGDDHALPRDLLFRAGRGGSLLHGLCRPYHHSRRPHGRTAARFRAPGFLWTSIIKSLVYAYIITSVSSYFGYTVGGGSVEVGKASTAAVVNSSVLILFCDVFLTQLLS